MIGVGRCLNHSADIIGDNDASTRPQPLDGFAHRERIVDPGPAMAWSTLRLTVLCNACIP
jgi:hypothetical protein